MRSLSILLISIVLALSLICFSGCGKSGEEAQSEAQSTESAATGTEEETCGEHGVLTSVTYTAVGATDDETFSYIASEEEEGKYIIKATYFDSEGNSHSTEHDIGLSDMEALRAIFDKYGYDELIGNRISPDLDDDDADGGPDYYFSATYADGSFFSADSAGDGAAELVSFFKDLAEK